MKFIRHSKAREERTVSGPWEMLRIDQAIRRTLDERRIELSDVTRTNWRSIANRFERRCRTLIGRLQPGDFWSYQRERDREGIGAATIGVEFAVLRCVLNRIGKRDLARGLPMRRKKTATPGKALSAEQKASLLEACRATPELMLAVQLGLSGLRNREVLSLRITDYDRASMLLNIPRSKTRAGIRRIPVDGKLADDLSTQVQRRQLEQDGKELDAPLFAPGKNSRQKHREGFWHAWKRARAEAGLESFRFHDLRHTAITELCEANVPDQVIQTYVGHVSPGMLQLYSHIRLEAMRQAATALQSPRTKPKETTCDSEK